MSANTILYILGAIVIGYFALVILVGIFKGWTAVTRIWFYTKKSGWLFLVLIGFFIVAYSLSRKNKDKQKIQDRLAELTAIENKTTADVKEAERLQEQAKEVEQSIADTSAKFKQKVDELKKKPDAPKPGDAANSSDAMNDVWK